MKSINKRCSSCSSETEHLNFGLVPESAFSYEESEIWFQALLCTECGALNRRNATETEQEITRQRLMSALREIGLYEELYGSDNSSGTIASPAGD
jgi:uncharacterized Zn finger protein